jgi:hypothetical protein
MIMKIIWVTWTILLLNIALAFGCSASKEPILPKGELTPQQIEEVRTEDQAIEDEESQGSNRKRK